MDVINAVRDAAEGDLSAQDHVADTARQAPVQCGDGQGGLPGAATTIAIAPRAPTSRSCWRRRSRTTSTSKPRRPTTSISSTRCTTAAMIDKGILHRLQRIQASAVCREHRRAGQRRLSRIRFRSSITRRKLQSARRRDSTPGCKIGIRIASEEEPKFDFYTSRLGIRYNDIVEYYRDQDPAATRSSSSRCCTSFINTGIKDTAYYWNELSKCLSVYCELKKICPGLDSLEHRQGGSRSRTRWAFDYDYEYMTEEIVAQIKNVLQPGRRSRSRTSFTEFGSFTVGESGATLFLDHQPEAAERPRELVYDRQLLHDHAARHLGDQPAVHYSARRR